MTPKNGLISGLVLLMLAGCADVRSSLPDIQVPDLSLSRKGAPAEVVIAPGRQTLQPLPPSGQVAVAAGDTIYILANRYQIYPQQIIDDNNLEPPYQLQPGQILRLTPANFHIVRRGDSLYSLSQRYAVSQYQLAELNGISEPFALTEGQRLQLPFSYDLSVLDSPEVAITLPARPSEAGTAVQASAAVVPPPKKAPRKNFVAPALTASDSFNWPLSGEVLTEFGPAERGIHNDGLNIAASAGTAIQTSAPGTVAFVGTGLKGFGTLVLVKHDGGYISAYAHLDAVSVAEGDVLGKGQVLGQVGTTGNVDQPQLHFEIRRNRTPINPRELIAG